MLDEALDAVDQTQFARCPCTMDSMMMRSRSCNWVCLYKLLSTDFSLLAALQFVDDAHPVAVAFIPDFGNAFQFLVVDQGGGGFDQTRLVHLVGISVTTICSRSLLMAQ